MKIEKDKFHSTETANSLDSRGHEYWEIEWIHLIFNGVLKWNYAHGANFYIVYTARKSVNGEIFSKWGKFFSYNKEGRWVETLRDQSIMVKIDYWFEL